MFTGIVEGIARIADVHEDGSSRRFRIATDDAFRRVKLNDGESIAVNGVCLTVERSGVGWFEATAVKETLSRTTIGSLVKDSRVNLERAATPQTLLGGHIVQGHVDATGRVVSFEGGTLVVKTPEDVHELCAEKGSIAVDGVSLTIARKLDQRRIEIAIVPYTLEKTIAAEYGPGRLVNLEADVIARYVREQLRRSGEFIGRTQV